jgi:hypothetical protein
MSASVASRLVRHRPGIDAAPPAAFGTEIVDAGIDGKPGARDERHAAGASDERCGAENGLVFKIHRVPASRLVHDGIRPHGWIILSALRKG